MSKVKGLTGGHGPHHHGKPAAVRPKDDDVVQAKLDSGAIDDAELSIMVTQREALATQASTIGPKAPIPGYQNVTPAQLPHTAMVGDLLFSAQERKDPGLLGGSNDGGPLGIKYETADALNPSGGYNDLHYWPDCQDPAYKALWDLRLAANKGDAAGRQTEDDLAALLLQARDRWKAGGTVVTTGGDPNYAEKTQLNYADALRSRDHLIALRTPGT